MRIAIVDVGTNTTRLFIADVDREKLTDEILRISRVTRLGGGVDAGGRLLDDALAREHAVLSDYHDLISTHGADSAVAVMTSAVRDAANGRDFAGDVADRYGLDVHVLSGDEEANLTYLGATDELNPTGPDADRKILVLDIGGGSTELVVGHGRTPEFHVSTQAGVVRQADRHIVHDPPTREELADVAADVRAVLERAVPDDKRRGIERALAVAGTPTSLAAIAQDLEPYDPARAHGYVLTAAERDEIFARLVALPLDQRREVRGLHPDRAVAILPGVVILTVAMELFGLGEVTVSEHDILRGAALAYAQSADRTAHDANRHNLDG
jgi:exopolyphosphatase/guanosine-5'-triphosphate,3'-diphosphate pyrophosphatase